MVTLTLRSGDINACTRVVHAWNTACTHVHAYAQAWQLAYQGIPGTNQSFRSSPIRESCAGSMTHPLIALIRKKLLIENSIDIFLRMKLKIPIKKSYYC